MRYRLRHLLCYGLKFISRAETREQQNPFKHCKTRPGADPRASGKRNEDGPLAVFCVLTVPTFRIKPIRIVPQTRMTMQMPGAQHHLASGRQIPTAKLLSLGSLSNHHRHRWVQARRFPKHDSGYTQPPQLFKACLRSQSSPLSDHFLLIVWMCCHEIERPGEAEALVSCPAKKKIAT